MSPLERQMTTLALRLAGLPLVALLAACASTPPQSHTSPDAAAKALADAARANSSEQLQLLFGDDAAELVGSGDAVDDANVRALFVELYDSRHKIVIDAAGNTATLEIGRDAWPFPVPLVKDLRGRWAFDTEAGAQEIIDRRVGRNELSTIETCRAICDAQREYAALQLEGKVAGEYAQRFLCSGAGKHDGLYWPDAAGGVESPLGELVAQAQEEGYTKSADDEPQPFHGYFYRMLSAQGPSAPGGEASYLADGRMTRGFAVIAYPAEYGSSGVMSFLVCANGIVYEADLGEDTADIARDVEAYDPDERWMPCE